MQGLQELKVSSYGNSLAHYGKIDLFTELKGDFAAINLIFRYLLHDRERDQLTGSVMSRGHGWY